MKSFLQEFFQRKLFICIEKKKLVFACWLGPVSCPNPRRSLADRTISSFLLAGSTPFPSSFRLPVLPSGCPPRSPPSTPTHILAWPASSSLSSSHQRRSFVLFARFVVTTIGLGFANRTTTIRLPVRHFTSHNQSSLSSPRPSRAYHPIVRRHLSRQIRTTARRIFAYSQRIFTL